MGDADLRGWGIWYFHGVDAKNVGATGKSPLRYQNIHLTMMGDADLRGCNADLRGCNADFRGWGTRIYADGGYGIFMVLMPKM
jgi:hypothetical protein